MNQSILYIIILICSYSLASIKKYAHYNEQKQMIINDDEDKYIAMGDFRDEVSKTGWNFLKVETNDYYIEDDQAYAAGYVEAYLTKQLIYNHYLNAYKGMYFNDKAMQFVYDSINYIEEQYKKNRTSPYWYQSHLLNVQLDGLIDGYREFSDNTTEISERELYYMAFFADLSDLNSTVNGKLAEYDHCSALIKVLPDNEDILMAQNSWYHFNFMTRIYKVYIFPFDTYYNSSEKVPSDIISMSSYPMAVFSFDDFYITNSGLIVQETTIGNNNATLMKSITSNSTFVSTRSMVANRLATNGKEWGDYYAYMNNGCYLNQFMVLDSKLFEPKKDLKNGTLYVIEQLPGYTYIHDMTSSLINDKYWPSYNAGAFPETREMANFTAKEKDDDYYTYDKNPRAKIFRRDHSNIKDIEAMRKIMRYNDYKNDEYSKCNCSVNYTAAFAIAMRGDLNPPDAYYKIPGWGFRNHAALDVKLSSAILVKNMIVNIIAGPTNENVPAFKWSTSLLSNISHVGMPDEYNFPWLKFDSINYNFEIISKNEDSEKNNVIFIISMVTLGVALLILIIYFVYRYIKKRSSNVNNQDIQQPLTVNDDKQ